MGERTSYAPGTISWTDLTASDQAAEKSFYTQLFGWEMIDFPVGDGVTYSIARLDGKDVADLPPDVRAAVEGRVVDERAYTELADRLECSESVVRKRVSRGLARLRKRIDEEGAR